MMGKYFICTECYVLNVILAEKKIIDFLPAAQLLSRETLLQSCLISYLKVQ